MKKQLPVKVERLLTELFTLIGESLVDNQIENRSEFAKAQDDVGNLLVEYNAPGFTPLNDPRSDFG